MTLADILVCGMFVASGLWLMVVVIGLVEYFRQRSKRP